MKKRMIFGAALAAMVMAVSAQTAADGGLDQNMLARLRSTYQNTPTDRALHNAISQNDVRNLAVNADHQQRPDWR